jgi:hypothetical protein
MTFGPQLVDCAVDAGLCPPELREAASTALKLTGAVMLATATLGAGAAAIGAVALEASARHVVDAAAAAFDLGPEASMALQLTLSVGAGVLGFFDTREARAPRLVCTELLAAVTSCPWADTETRLFRREVVMRLLRRLRVDVLEVLVMLVGLTVALIVFTPLKYYIPGYGSRTDREKLMQLKIRADSLESSIQDKQVYWESVRDVLNGNIKQRLDTTMLDIPDPEKIQD